MFASFQITPDGHLTQAQPRPKLVRSDDGCLPCRRKRKRCDKTKPACLRCRNSTNRDVCKWPEITRSRRDNPDEDQCLVSHNNVPWHSYDQDDQWFDDGSWELPSLTLYRLGSLEPYRLPDAVINISPDLTFPRFLKITLAFQHKVLSRESEYSGSFFLMGIPNTKCNSALANAWIASSLAAVAPETSHWQQKALLHHSQALLELRRGIENEDVIAGSTGEWKRATVLMLHIFETLASQNYGNGLAISHLNAAHRIFGESVRRAYPSSIHDCMLHDAYILRTVLNCLFRTRVDSSITFADQLLKHLNVALELLGETSNLRNCPWTHQAGHELLNSIYRASWLAHRVPLRGQDTLEAVTVSHLLGEWKCPTFDEAVVGKETAQWVSSIAKLFWYACSLLCSLLISTIQGTANQMSQELHFREGTELLEKLSKEDHIKAALMWPLVVLGLMCPDDEHLRLFKDISHRIEISAGKEVMTRATAAIDGMYALRKKKSGIVSAYDWIRFVEGQDLFI